MKKKKKKKKKKKMKKKKKSVTQEKSMEHSSSNYNVVVKVLARSLQLLAKAAIVRAMWVMALGEYWSHLKLGYM